MKRTRLTLILLVAGICACPAQQQLTLQRCLELAKSFNLKSHASEKAIRASELSRDELSKTGLPQVKLSSEASYAPNSGRTGYDPAITDGGQLSGRIVVEQSLYDAGVRGIRSSQLSVERDALMKERQLTERDVVFEVEQLFIEGLRSQRAMELQQQSMRQLREYLDLVERLTKGGGASTTDLLKTQVQLQDAERGLRRAQASLSLAKYGLAEFTGGSIDTSFSLAGSLESLMQSTGSASATVELPRNLEISLAELNVNKSIMETEISKRESYPVISAFADAGLLTSIDNLRLVSPERAGVYGYSIGVTLEMPIFTWGARDLRVQQKELATEALGFELEATRRSVTTEFQKARFQLLRVDEQLQSLRKSTQVAEENFVLTKSKYAVGGTLSLEVLSAQQMLTDLRLEELQNLADKQALLSKIEQITTQ